MAAPVRAGLLVGGGHAHVQVIKALNAAARPPHVRVSLIEPQLAASYSGMVPGCVAGLYTAEETQIQLGPLAKWASIDLLPTRVVELDPEAALKRGENPGPLVELEFWESKATNLDSIFEQLQGDRIRKVLRFLDSSKSTYNSPFAKLCKEV